MTSGQIKYDEQNENLIREIQNLKERLEQLERHALTSENIRANKLIVGGSQEFGNIPDGTLSMQQVLQLTNTATQGPYAGKGLELYYSGGSDVGRVQAYDRDAATYEDLEIKGSFVYLMSGGSYVRITLSDTGNIRLHADAQDITHRTENNQAYRHDEFRYHFDGSDYPMSGFMWQTYGSRVVPSFGAESQSKLYWGLDKGGGATNWEAFYAKTSDMQISASFLPHFSNSSQPLRVGYQWSDGTDNNYVKVYWESTIDGSGYAIVTPYMKSVNGGGAATTTQLMGSFPAGALLPLLRGNVEGTQWSNWAIRTFVSGWYVRRWLPSHSSKTWTPTRCGIFLDNASGSNTSWQYFGFDALHTY